MSRLYTALIAIAFLPFCLTADAGQFDSTARGFYIAPVTDVRVNYIPGDEAQPRAFEIIRPNNERFTIGRLFTSCSCVQLETNKRTFERGERAFFTLRNVKATPPNGQNYAFFIQIESPVAGTLRHDLFLQSDRFRSGNQIQTVQYSY